MTVAACAILGAGAAGLMASIFAGRGGTRCVLLESRERPGAKIKISGGGRCNVLPSVVELDDFHTAGSTRAMRNVFASWPLEQVRAFFEDDLRVPLELERETGKLFPASQRAQDVLDALLDASSRAGADLIGGFRVESVAREPSGFAIASSDGRKLVARRIVLATGGLSVPKTGSDGRGLEIARALGHSIAPTYPALVPLLGADATLLELAGIALRVRLRAVEGDRVLEQREDDLLFTHRGFSGPVVLDLSHRVARPGGDRVRLLVEWLGERRPRWDEHLRQGGRKTVGGLLRDELPRRLVAAIAARAEVDLETPASELARDGRKRLVAALTAFELRLAGNEGYKTAEVTGGGVPLAEVATSTLESRIVPGLHLCGEILDVTGRIGGFNFLWAWVSGRLAGQALASSASPVEASGTSGD